MQQSNEKIDITVQALLTNKKIQTATTSINKILKEIPDALTLTPERDLLPHIINLYLGVHEFLQDNNTPKNIAEAYAAIHTQFPDIQLANPALNELQQAFDKDFQLLQESVSTKSKKKLNDSVTPLKLTSSQLEPYSQNLDQEINTTSQLIQDAWKAFSQGLKYESNPAENNNKKGKDAIQYIYDEGYEYDEGSKRVVNKIDDAVAKPKYLLSFAQDSKIIPLFQSAFTSLKSIDLDNPQSVDTALDAISTFYIRLTHHTDKLNDTNPDSVATASVAFLEHLQKQNIAFDFKELGQENALIPLSFLFSNYAANRDELIPKVKTDILSSIKENADVKGAEELIIRSASTMSKRITFFLNIITSGTDNHKSIVLFENRLEKLALKTADADQQLKPTYDKAVALSQAALTKDRSLQATIKDAIQAKQKTVTPPTPTLEKLRATQPDVPLDLEAQAVFKHDVAVAKYTLTSKETQLLSKITGIPFSKIGPESSDDVKSFELARNEILHEIDKRNGINKHWYRGILIPKQRTEHLIAAARYLKYYQHNFQMTTSPENRLGAEQETAGKHRNHKDFGEYQGTNFRSWLAKQAYKLSGLFSSNRALRDLSFELHKKEYQARNLKEEHTPLLTSAKASALSKTEKVNAQAVRNYKITSTIDTTGSFFKPNNLAKAIKGITQSQNFPVEQQLTEDRQKINEIASLIQGLTDLSNRVETRLKGNRDSHKGDMNTLIDDLDVIKQKAKSAHQQLASQNISAKDLLKLKYTITRLTDSAQALKKTTLDHFADQLTLQKGLNISYNEIVQLSSQLTEASKLTKDFNPRDDLALNQVGRSIAQAKWLKERLINSVDIFDSCLKMAKEANAETIFLLESFVGKIQQDATFDVNEAIDVLLPELYSQIEALHVQNEDIEKMSPRFNIKLKINEIRSNLQALQSRLLESNGKDAPSEIINQQVQELQNKQKKLEKDAADAAPKLKATVEAAQAHVKSLIYLADHTTTAFSGLRK